MSSSNAARVQGAGPNCTDGDPIQVCIKDVVPGVCVPVKGCPGDPPVEVSIADCEDVTQGCINDAAVTGDNPGTISAKFRGLLKLLGEYDNTIDPGTGFPFSQAGKTPTPGEIAFLFGFDRDTQRWQSVPLTRLSGGGIQTGALANTPHLLNLFGSYLPGIAYDAADIAGNEARIAPAGMTAWDGAQSIRLRTPATFNTVQANAAGNTALWTPAAGKKFRLTRYCVVVTGDAATAGGAVVVISLFDGAAGATGQVHAAFCPAVALAAGALYVSPWVDLGNGYLSAAANNVLNVNLSAALTAGVVNVICCGTEE